MWLTLVTIEFKSSQRMAPLSKRGARWDQMMANSSPQLESQLTRQETSLFLRQIVTEFKSSQVLEHSSSNGAPGRLDGQFNVTFGPGC